MNKRINKPLSYPRLIVLYILSTIIAGTILLMLPISSRSGEWVNFETAFFTATSASCVTGLVLVDTYTFWSTFGQIVILFLIQIGGLGFMSFITLVSHAFGKRIGLRDRRLIMESSGSLELDGILHLLKKVVLGTILIEFCGAVLLSFRFCKDFGIGRGIYFSIFHAVSAFCNAGFDLMGINSEFSSLTEYVDDPLVNVTLIFLILLGGLGFIVWDDILKNKFNFKRYRLHTKLVLTATAILVIVPSILFFVLEYNRSMKELDIGGKIIASVFQAITPRTAGFATLDNTEFSAATVLMTVSLMLIGGNSGSTAGGMKVTTILVLLLSMVSSARKSNSINVFRRRIDNSTVQQASSIAFIYVITTIIGTCILSAVDNVDLTAALFEISSAVGTVGSSMSMTPSLSSFSHYMLALMMFFGRAGGLTMALVFVERKNNIPATNPAEKILIG